MFFIVQTGNGYLGNRTMHVLKGGRQSNCEGGYYNPNFGYKTVGVAKANMKKFKEQNDDICERHGEQNRCSYEVVERKGLV